MSMVSSWLCAIYVEQIAQLGATYGSVGAVVVLLIWLSWNVNAIFYGGAFATEMEIAARSRGAPGHRARRRARLGRQPVGAARVSTVMVRTPSASSIDTTRPPSSRHQIGHVDPRHRIGGQQASAARPAQRLQSPSCSLRLGTGQRWPRASTIMSLTPPRRPQQQAQGHPHAVQPHRLAPDVAEPVLLMLDAVRTGAAEMDQADRLLRRAAAGAGDAGDRHGQIDAASAPRAPSAMARATGSDTAPCGSIRSGRHAQHLGLGGVAVGDEAPVDDGRRPRDGRQGARDQPAGAAFGRRHRPAARRARRRSRRRARRLDIVREHAAFPIACASRSRVGLARRSCRAGATCGDRMTDATMPDDAGLAGRAATG